MAADFLTFKVHCNPFLSGKKKGHTSEIAETIVRLHKEAVQHNEYLRYLLEAIDLQLFQHIEIINRG